MRVLFIYSDLFPSYVDWTGSWSGYYYSGIGILSSVLKNSGHETSLIHVTQPILNREYFLERIKSFDAELIAFSSTSLTFRYVYKMAKWIYEAKLRIPVISGGIHSTLLPLEVIQTPGIDMVCVGEGEESLLNLVENLHTGKDIRKLPGIWVKDKEKICKNGVSPIIDDLTSLPYEDRTVFDYPILLTEKSGTAIFMTSRGCPYHCAYCSNQALKKALCSERPSRYDRRRSVDHVMGEIKKAIDDYSFIKVIQFNDATFVTSKKWLEEFRLKYSDQVGLPFICNMRPNCLNDKMARLLKESGCVKIKLGIESGNEWIRNKVLKRNLTDQQLFNAFRCCRDAGIETHAYNIVGIPFEKPCTVLDTIKMNARIEPDSCLASIFYPFPKTELYDLCNEKGLITTTSGYDFYKPQMKHDTLSKRQIYFFSRNFRILVAMYARACRLHKRISKVLVSTLDLLLTSFCLNFTALIFSWLRKARSFFLSLSKQV